MASDDFGSLTKEPPLGKLDQTLAAIAPGMPYAKLLSFARRHTHRDAPGLLRKRFLLVDASDVIVYDRFLSLAHSEGLDSPRVRKVMYFVWAFRDERIRRFICEVVADQTGRWRVRELTKKSNAVFFEKWFPPPSTTPSKARSNVEFFLQEAGIFDSKRNSIELGLQDGWLSEAMQVAAQHERSAARRRAMTSAPIEFLIANGLNCLVNATAAELRGVEEQTIVETEPLEDSGITVAPAATAASRKWAERTPVASGKATIRAIIDQVARERASRAHHEMEKLLAAAARARGYQPLCNDNIDLYFSTPAGAVLAEIKSCHERNLHSQIRRGVSQLLEYRFVYRKELGDPVTLVLVIETGLTGGKEWLADFLRSLDILLAWQSPDGTGLVTETTIPVSLDKVVFPAS